MRGRKDYIGCEERTNQVVYTSNELAHYGRISSISQCIDPALKAQLQNVGIFDIANMHLNCRGRSL